MVLWDSNHGRKANTITTELKRILPKAVLALGIAFKSGSSHA